MARKSARSVLMLRRLDRLPLRSSGRIHGDPIEPMLDRFAMLFTGTRIRASGLRCREQERLQSLEVGPYRDKLPLEKYCIKNGNQVPWLHC